MKNKNTYDTSSTLLLEDIVKDTNEKPKDTICIVYEANVEVTRAFNSLLTALATARSSKDASTLGKARASHKGKEKEIRVTTMKEFIGPSIQKYAAERFVDGHRNAAGPHRIRWV
ncbi:hypothetical protein Tco_0061198 [Tanacetum coccineum]